MPLVLDTTPGSATANAYADIAYADALADTVFPAPVSWGSTSPDNKARILAFMSREIDQLTLRGDQATPGQALAFPRRGAPLLSGSGSWDGYGGVVGGFELTSAIPSRVQRATAIGAFELAKRLAESLEDEPSLTGAADEAGISSMSLGSELSLSFGAGATSISSWTRFLSGTIYPILGNLAYVGGLAILR